MQLTSWIAVAVIVLTVAALVKKWDVRTTLLCSGLFLCCTALKPLDGLNQFAKMMTNGTLVQAICGAMGFAFVITLTKCDLHLVGLLSKPLKKLGILLIPACTIVTLLVNTAIPSAAGCAAAVGASLIPVMIRAGIKPVGAGAAILAGTIGSFMNPGSPHQNMVGGYVGISGMEFILKNMNTYLILWAIAVIGVTVVEFIRKDYRGGESFDGMESLGETVKRINILKAFAPLFPLVLLIIGNTCLPMVKMGVAQAMVVGAIFAIFAICVTGTNPSKVVNEFFNGCGKGFANIVSIIISASVFAMGLRASGLVGDMIEVLKTSNEYARWFGILGPYFMAILVGSGDAATMAFNEAVTPHAATFGMSVIELGNLAYVSGALGRTMSPIAGVVIVIAGLCRTNPLSLVQRTAPAMIVAILSLLIFS